MPSRRIALRVTEHPGDLADPVLAMKRLHVAGGNPSPRRFRYHQVMVGPGGDLRQVSNGEHLVALGNIR